MIELKILGAIDLRDGEGKEVRAVLVQPKRLALLAYLAIARPRGFHRRDALLPIFWPELSESRARHALRQSLHFLRQALGGEVILTRGSEEVAVNPNSLFCDAVRFEECVERQAWERAVGLYDGPLLNAIAVHHSHEFERWLEAERLRLGDSYVRALDGLVALSEGSDPGKVVTWLRRRVEHDPYDSEVTLRLMRALESANDRPGALQLAKSHRNLVIRDLDTRPDQRIEALAARLADVPMAGLAVTPSKEPDAPRPKAVAEKPAPFQTWPRRLIGVLGVLVVLSGLGWFVTDRLTERPAVRAATTTLIIAPFVTLTDSADQYLADGIAEGVLSRLATVASLRVIGWVKDDIAAAETLLTATRQFEDAWGLRASVQRDRLGADSSRVRLVTTITRARDESAVWRATYDQDFSNIVALERDIAIGIVDGLGASTLVDERAILNELPTQHASAYEQYLLGSAALNREGWIGREWTAFGARVDFPRAVQHFEAALTIDSSFILPLARLAIANTSMFHWKFDRTPGRLDRARRAMEEAIRLRPDLQLTHLAAAWYYYLGEFEYNRALRHLRMASTGWAGTAEVMLLTGGIRRRQGDLTHALDQYTRAEIQAGICPECQAEMSYTHYAMGDMQLAERSIERALALSPDLHLPRHVGALLRLTEYGDSAGAFALLHPIGPGSDDIMHLARGRWSALSRILSNSFDGPLARLTLEEIRSDTGGFYLAKAGLASRQGHPELARQYYDSARIHLERMATSLANDPLIRSELGLAYAGLGQRVEAIREGTMAVRLRPISHDALDGPIFVEALAQIYMILGELDAAVGQLEDMVEIPGWMSEQLLRLDPLWEPLCGHPRFANLTGASAPT